MYFTQTEEMRVALGDGVCSEGLFWVAIKVEQGTEAAGALLRPLPALRFGLLMIRTALFGLFFRK